MEMEIDMAHETDEQSPEMPLPPADFSFLVSSLMFQAQLELGLLQFGDEKETPEPNLPRAKHSIDLLGVIEEKTKGNLTPEENELLTNGLAELRYIFIQISEELGSKVEAKPEEDRPRIITSGGGKGTKSA
jgi:hypothetical protein